MNRPDVSFGLVRKYPELVVAGIATVSGMLGYIGVIHVLDRMDSQPADNKNIPTQTIEINSDNTPQPITVLTDDLATVEQLSTDN